VGREGGKMLTLLASREPLLRVNLMVCDPVVSEVSAVSIDDGTWQYIEIGRQVGR
jgi:hypothetical protein